MAIYNTTKYGHLMLDETTGRLIRGSSGHILRFPQSYDQIQASWDGTMSVEYGGSYEYDFTLDQEESPPVLTFYKSDATSDWPTGDLTYTFSTPRTMETIGGNYTRMNWVRLIYGPPHCVYLEHYHYESTPRLRHWYKLWLYQDGTNPSVFDTYSTSPVASTLVQRDGWPVTPSRYVSYPTSVTISQVT